MNLIQFGLDNRPIFFLTGCRSILFIAKKDIVDIKLNPADANLVDDIILLAGKKWNLFNEQDNISYTLTPDTSVAGTLYKTEISFTHNLVTREKNALIQSLLKNELTAIIQDRSNRLWLLGDQQPLRVTESLKTINNDVNQYSVKVTNIQRDDAKEMSSTWANNLNVNSFTSMLDSESGTVSAGVIFTSNQTAPNQNPTGATFIGNNFQNTVTSPPSGYVIGSTVGVVFAAAGSTINLPPAAVIGQQHTVKDFSGSAGTASIQVNGNGGLIDNAFSIKINTNYGSITFTYSVNGWMTNAFVN